MTILFSIIKHFFLYFFYSLFLSCILLSKRLLPLASLILVDILLSAFAVTFLSFVPSILLVLILVVISSLILNCILHGNFKDTLCKLSVLFIFFFPVYLVWFGMSIFFYIFLKLNNFQTPFLFSAPFAFLLTILYSRFFSQKRIKAIFSYLKKPSLILFSWILLIYFVFISAIWRNVSPLQSLMMLLMGIITLVIYLVLIIKELTYCYKENSALTRLLHDSSRRSFERAAEIDAASPKAEVSALAELNAVNHSYDPAVEENPSDYIDSTGMPLIDEMLQNYYLYACRRGIDFRVYVHDPLTLLFSDYTSYWKQISDTIGNLVANAITAVEKSHAERPEVFCAFGVVAGKHYEIHIFDSGLDFPAKVLERLGEEGNTTGGSGIGMMSILEASRVAKFSLRIQEGEPCYPYTKKIFVVFDGEGRIEIETWRAAQLHVHNPRITVKQLGGELHV